MSGCPIRAALEMPLDLSPIDIAVADVGMFPAWHVPQAQRYAAIRVPGSQRWQIYDCRKRELGCQLANEREMRGWMIGAARSILKDRAARPERRATLARLKQERKARAIAKAAALGAAPAQLSLI